MLTDQDIDRIDDALRYTGKRIATAITPDAIPYTDPEGVTVSSLTEAIISLSLSMREIAESIDRAVDAFDEHNQRIAK